MSADKLRQARLELDALDGQLLALLKQRGRLVRAAMEARLAMGEAGRDRSREQELVGRLLESWEASAEDAGAYDSSLILRVWQVLFEVSDER